jgi:heme-degrading monooxygenase HmoA
LDKELSMIARYWRGLAHCDQADAYLEHLRAETLPALARLAGFIEASVMRRELACGTEFLVVTSWVSLESIRAFAGANIEVAVVPAVVQDMMIEYDDSARHYEVMSVP